MLNYRSGAQITRTAISRTARLHFRKEFLTQVAILLAFAAAGCSEKPKAPALVNETVYSYDSIGLRFMTPQGWSITSRANLPPGPLTKPMMLVAYHLKGMENPAALEVLAADLPEETDLSRYLLESRIGQGDWTIKSAPERKMVNGSEALHFLLSHRTGQIEDLRDITAFRRGERVYFFIISYAANDPSSLIIGIASVQTVTWTKK